jgi:hypothetical protein
METTYEDEKPAPRWPSVKLAGPVIWLLVLFAFPPEISISLGPLRMSPYRVLLIIMVLPSLLQLLSNRFGTTLLVDWLILFHTIWAMIALLNWEGLAALQTAGIYFIECFGSYIIGRRYIRNADDFHALSRFFTFFVISMLLIAVPETLSGKAFIRDTFKAVFGGPTLEFMDPRMGLTRVYGPFDHPILFGTFCAWPFSMALFVLRPFYSTIKGIIIPVLVFAACFLSLSAGPWLAVGIQLMLAVWNKITKGIPMRWGIIFLLLVLSVFTVSLFSNRPAVNVFISYASFSPVSSYNRILIWEYGSAEVGRNWWLGIGLGDWIRPAWMSNSMDNFWLINAVRYGMPALLALVGAIACICIGASRQRDRDEDWVACRYAWMITLFGISFAATTVHLWNAIFCLFFFFVGSGVFMTSRWAETKTQAEQEAEERALNDEENEYGWNDEPRQTQAV